MKATYKKEENAISAARNQWETTGEMPIILKGAQGYLVLRSHKQAYKLISEQGYENLTRWWNS